jgi:phage terminase large subunit-like protein
LIQTLPIEQVYTLLYDWELMARPEQLEPEIPWTIWLLMTGRGWGKTLTGAQTTRKKVKEGAQHVALVAPTAADARDVMLGIIPDSSGIMQVCPPCERPEYQPSYRRAVWPNGAVATLYSAE